MDAPLLETKLYVPPSRPSLVPRPRLVARLDEGLCLGRKLILVSAPAGFGKTTLLGEWVAAGERPVAWLSLDEGDEDPARFWTYFVAALQTIEPGVGESVLSAFQTPRSPVMESVLTPLVNELSAISPGDGEGTPGVLVLDDYHLITAQSIHDGLTFLLDHLPPSLRLVISTRADPPLALARLRGRGQLVELRQTDLRFTTDEAAALLNAGTGLDLSVADLTALEARTEGWIAGLQMAALSMHGQDDLAGFIQAFTGSDRHILDYLLEEVLHRQPDGVQTFLLRTSILDRLTAPLCDAVLGVGEGARGRMGETATGQETLEYLERHNLFVVPLDRDRCWYRYHHLFADLLRHRLRQMEPDLVPILHGRAGAWYEQQGLVPEAIDHALAAGDPDWGAHLVEEAAEATMLCSQFSTLLGWVEALPDDLVRGLPRLSAYCALAMVFAGRPLDAAQARLQEAVGADAGDAIAGESLAFQALLAAYQGDRERSAEVAQRALELLPESSLFFRSFIAGFLGLAYLYVGDVEAAAQAFEEAVRVSERTGNLNIAVLARHHLAELAMLRGRTDESAALYQQALDVAVDERGRRRPIAGIALIGLGRMKSELYQLEAATRCLTEGIELIERWGEVGAITGYTGLARVRHAQGDEPGVDEALQMAQRLAEKFDAMEMDDLSVALYRAQIQIARGEVEAAARWVEGRGLAEDLSLERLHEEIRTTSSLYRFREYALLALLRMAQDRPGDAVDLLGTLRQAAEDAGWVVYQADVLAMEALAREDQGDTTRALAALGQAISLAEPGGFVHLFIEKGPAMARLLYRAAAEGIEPEYAGKLLAAFPDAEPAEPRERSPAELIEPLSEREIEVLQLVAEGLTNREIAQRLYLSVSTVKVHTYNIYGKLDVHSRTQAVARARVLGVLPAATSRRATSR